MTTRHDVDDLGDAGRHVVEMARRDLVAYFASLDLTDPAAVRDALLEFVPILTTEYGEVAAVAAAEWYEEVRAAQVAGTYRAVPGAVAPVEAVQGSVRYAAGHLFGDDPAQALAVISGAIQRHILYAQRDTVARNVKLDPRKPRFARVPMGPKTCAWCSMLASRGFVYLTRETAGIIRDHYHDDCDCAIVSSWTAGQSHIDGYDPDALYGMYLTARQATGNVSDQNAIAAEMRRLFPESFTDGVFAD